MDGQFIDYVKIYCKSGDGGAGVVSWRREKGVPRGGPDGGDGGRGAHIIIRGNAQKWTLLDLKYHKFINADNGERGGSRKCTGKDGKNIVLEAPVGTVIKNAETDQFLGEILENGEEIILLQGGRGGKGNWFFRTSTNQTPEHSQPGETGIEMAIILELKVLADVGLVGFPNAGKSTLLASLTAAKPAIADYPFTTLTPNLGIVKHRDYQSFVMADIPGIIEGASEGRGLGLRFLRHIERNAVLLFLIPITSENFLAEYEILQNELANYDEELITKPSLIALTKCDLVDAKELKKLTKKLPKTLNFVYISGITGFGLEELKDKLWTILND